MKPRQRTCPNCKDKFMPYNSFQKYCFNTECIKVWNKITRDKKNRAAKKDFNQNDKSMLTKLAQQVFNKYIRKRDGDKCITCGNTNRQIHAGHYRPVGRNAKLRFNEINTHSQCSICNNHLSGNLVPYRKAMIGLYGLSVVEELEADNEPYKYSIEELQEIIQKYKQKFKELSNN